MEEKEYELFTMTPREIMETKHRTLTEIRLKEAKIIDLKQKIKKEETHQWLTANFKEAKCTTDKLRGAYVKDKVLKDQEKLDWLEYDLKQFKHNLTLIDDVLKLIENGNW
jgi:hypothetical protein